VLNLRRIR